LVPKLPSKASTNLGAPQFMLFLIIHSNSSSNDDALLKKM
jgi:hypothetical protein